MAATITVINPTTNAVATKQPIDARAYETIIVAAPGLAGAEEVGITLGGGADWAIVTLPDGSAAKLTATQQSLELPAAMYGITKTATAAAVGVQVTLID